MVKGTCTYEEGGGNNAKWNVLYTEYDTLPIVGGQSRNSDHDLPFFLFSFFLTERNREFSWNRPAIFYIFCKSREYRASSFALSFLP